MLNGFSLLFIVCLSAMVHFTYANVNPTRIGGFRDLSSFFPDALFLYLSIAHFAFDFFCVSKPVKVY